MQKIKLVNLMIIAIIIISNYSYSQEYVESKVDILTNDGEIIHTSRIKLMETRIAYELESGKVGNINKDDVYKYRIVPDSLPYLKMNVSKFEPIVVSIPDKTAEELYNNAKYWISDYFKNPDEVLKTEEKNKSIRIEAFKDNIAYQKSFASFTIDGYYSIELDFKDGKYRLRFYPGKVSANGAPSYYTLDAYLKKGAVRPMYKQMFASYEFNTNEISADIYMYMKGKVQEIEDDW